MTDLLGKHAVNEIRRMSASRDPFLLSLHFTAPHWPWEGPGDEAVAAGLKEAMHHDGGTIATYRKMIESLDANIAKVLAALKASGKERDTLVMFTSDNGGERFSKTWPFNGMKGELLEGGIRVPLIARWPGHIRRGLGHAADGDVDGLPADAARRRHVAPDASRPPDGISLLPAFGNASRVHGARSFLALSRARPGRRSPGPVQIPAHRGHRVSVRRRGRPAGARQPQGAAARGVRRAEGRMGEVERDDASLQARERELEQQDPAHPAGPLLIRASESECG